MSKVWISLAASAAAACALGQTSSTIYTPVKSVKDQEITLKSWGSGVVSETDEMSYEGTHSIRVSGKNLFQGLIVSLGKPVDMNGQYGDKNNLLRFMIAFSSKNSMSSGSMGGPMGGPGMGGQMGGPMGGSMGSSMGSSMGGNTGARGGGQGTRGGGTGTKGGGSGTRGGGQGTGGPGGMMGGPGGMKGGPGGNMGSGSTLSAAETTIKNVRVIIITTDGKRSEAFIPVSSNSGKAYDFKAIAVPLQGIAGFDKTNKIIKEVAISGDAISTYYVGDIGVYNDPTPIMADINVSSTNLALNDEITLSAIANGGSSVLVYSWDFDESDGVQTDSEGITIKRKFRKPGKIMITLTVSDKYGLKAPVTKKVEIEVNP